MKVLTSIIGVRAYYANEKEMSLHLQKWPDCQGSNSHERKQHSSFEDSKITDVPRVNEFSLKLKFMLQKNLGLHLSGSSI